MKTNRNNILKRDKKDAGIGNMIILIEMVLVSVLSTTFLLVTSSAMEESTPATDGTYLDFRSYTETGSIGRFFPTHVIKRPVFCASCHPEHIVELNSTTHLPYFSQIILEIADDIAAPNTAGLTTAEAVSGGLNLLNRT